MKNLKPRRYQGTQESGMGPRSRLVEQRAAGYHEKNGEDEARALYREMEDWYREEENHNMAGTV
jgi:hypothetical protein